MRRLAIAAKIMGAVAVVLTGMVTWQCLKEIRELRERVADVNALVVNIENSTLILRAAEERKGH